mgnify:CR=1 FL=1
MFQKKHLFFILLLAGFVSAQEVPKKENTLFQPTIESSRPWVYWYWMQSAYSKEGITADLEAMKQAGIGGAYLMTIKGPANPPLMDPPVLQLSKEFWNLVHWALTEADRLGVKIAFHPADGFAVAGGPWITPENSMQKVVWADTFVNGGAKIQMQLPVPNHYKDYYKDIAVFAIPVKESFVSSKAIQPKITSTIADFDASFLSDSKKDDQFRLKEKGWIQYEFDKPFLCKSIQIETKGNNFQAHRLIVEVSDDGINFKNLGRLTTPRQGWQDADAFYTHSIVPTKAKYFRFVYDPEGTEPGAEDLDPAKWNQGLKVAKIYLSNEPLIDNYQGKSGAIWRLSPQTSAEQIGKNDCVEQSKMINISKFVDANGTISWLSPKGKWRIIRMGYTSTGHENATAGAGRGLEVDKFNAEAVRFQLNHWFGEMLRTAGPELASKVVKILHMDSWECGSQNWSPVFQSEFKKRRGYDIVDYLPVMAGIPLNDIATSEKVLYDVRKTISELIVDNFFGVLADEAKKAGVKFSSENVAPTMMSEGLLHFKYVDYPSGEFWLKSPTHDKPNDMLDAISGAHIYGKNIIQAEGFTQLRTNWNEDPAMLKPLLDRNFALGINKLFFHVFVHNPYTDKAPGTTLNGIGLFFQRDQTWWKHGKAFVDYVARCQTMLQYGKPVVDIAVFTGEEIPSRALTPDKLVPLLPRIVGKERVESEQKRLANVNQPMREMPAGVNHSANILKAEDWINPLNGYAYDSFNKDALLQAKAENGKMVLPGGAAYSAVIIPHATKLSKPVTDKLAQLKQSGVSIPKLPILNGLNIEPDIILPPNIAWTHRRSENMDIYFITNQQNTAQSFGVSFRNQKGIPQLWNPVNGDISIPSRCQQSNDRVYISIDLHPYESVFIVFGEKAPLNQTNQLQAMNSYATNDIKFNWKINFQNNKQSIVTEMLFDWSKSENPLIKYYSGTAIYQSNFVWNDNRTNVWINLGKVSNLASVRINGIDCGTAWTAPYEVDITKALKKGTNALEIEVTNTWANAINGADKGTPPFEGIWTDGKYRLKEDKLLEAGLLGPITIIRK